MDCWCLCRWWTSWFLSHQQVVIESWASSACFVCSARCGHSGKRTGDFHLCLLHYNYLVYLRGMTVCRRVISRAPGLKLVVETLITSLRPIGNIVLICCAFFIVFGILGVQVNIYTVYSPFIICWLKISLVNFFNFFFQFSLKKRKKKNILNLKLLSLGEMSPNIQSFFSF